jgi:uncharacterized protein
VTRRCGRWLPALLCGAAGAAAADAAPSFDCRQVPAGSIAAQVCADASLAQLDRQLADVYAAARKVAAGLKPVPPLAAEQRGWVKGRDACWKDTDRRACVQRAYQQRTAELQARYRLLPARGPVRLACDGDPRNELVVHYFATDPPSLIAERGDETSWMLQQPRPGPAHYLGRNETIDDASGTLTVVWGYQARPMTCRPAA